MAGDVIAQVGGRRKANRNRKVRSGISVIHSIVNLIEPGERDTEHENEEKVSKREKTRHIIEIVMSIVMDGR